MGDRHRAGLLRVVDEVTLCVELRVLAEDLDGALRRAHRAVAPQTVEEGTGARVGSEGGIPAQAPVRDVVEDADREAVASVSVGERVEDALHATRAAIEEGILPGGGAAFLRTLPVLNKLIDTLSGDEKVGAGIVYRAIQAPIKEIVFNAGKEGAIVIQKLLELKEMMK